jgi:hypothetical protein
VASLACSARKTGSVVVNKDTITGMEICYPCPYLYNFPSRLVAEY